MNLTNPARATLTFTDAGGRSLQRRELALEHGLDQIGCESLADVIEASVLAMTRRHPPFLRSARAPVHSDAGTRRTRRARRSHHADGAPIRPDAAVSGDRPALAIAYTLEPAATDILQSGVELAFDPDPGRLRRRDWLRAAYTFPATANADGASARWQSLSADLGDVYRQPRPPRLVRARDRLGINVTFVETRSPDAEESPASSSKTQVAPDLLNRTSPWPCASPRAPSSTPACACPSSPVSP